MRLQAIIENISFANLNLPLSVVDELFEDKRYTEIEKLKLFSTIVDEIDLSNNFTELIRLIASFSEKYDYSGFKRYDLLSYKIFNKTYNGDNQIVAFMYLYDAIIKAGNDVRKTPTRRCPKCSSINESWSSKCLGYTGRGNKCNYEFRNFPIRIKHPTRLIVRRFPDLLKAFEGFNYRLYQYKAFSSMISLIDTEVIAKYCTLIENFLENLLYNWYQLPEDLGEKYIKKKGLFSDLVRGIEGTDLLDHKAPYFTKLVELISLEVLPTLYTKSGKFVLLSLIGLKEGQHLMESQWSSLLFVFENMIDNFYKMDEENIHLFHAASLFVKILLQKKPELIKQIFVDKISFYIANLNTIKKKFPKGWNSLYEKEEKLREKEDKERQEINKILREEFE